MLKIKSIFLIGSLVLLTACGGGGSANSQPTVPTVPSEPATVWRQTSNSIEVDPMAIYIKEGFNVNDFFGQGFKSFFFAPDGIIHKARNQSDPDFLLYSIGPNNTIRQDPSPLATKYIAGHVNDTLIGNFGKGPNSMIFIDHGREIPGGTNNSNFEFSYLWRMDKVNGNWAVTEFAQEFGKQFWHASSNPLDVNGDGILDFAVSALSDAVGVLFLSNNAGGHTGVSYKSKLPEPNSGTSALIKIAGGKFAVISLPYNAQPSWNSFGTTGSIMTLSSNGTTVVSTQSINVRGYGITDAEGYSTIKVVDLNNDGLDDFVALAECMTGCNPQTKRIIAYTQNANGTFSSANTQLGIPYTYSLPNQATSDQWVDSVGTHLAIFSPKAGAPLSIQLQSTVVSRSQISAYGIRGGLSFTGTALSALPENIIWNNGPRYDTYSYVIPTDLNNDGIVDYVLVGLTFNGVKTPDNPHGQVGHISALISEVK